MEYRRAKTPGGTFFFTVITHNRRKFLCTPAIIRQMGGRPGHHLPAGGWSGVRGWNLVSIDLTKWVLGFSAFNPTWYYKGDG